MNVMTKFGKLKISAETGSFGTKFGKLEISAETGRFGVETGIFGVGDVS